MRKICSFAIIAMAFAMSLASCNAIDENLETEFPEKLGPVTQNVPYVTASLVPDVTRTAYSMPDGYTLTAVWSVNDRISVVPALAYPDYAGIYRITEAGGGVGVFAQESPVMATAELNYFLNWDASVFLPTRSEVRSEVHPPMLEAGLQPSAPQVMHIGHWEDGRFVEEKSYRM